MKMLSAWALIAAVTGVAVLGCVSSAAADDDDAKALLKSMSDYLAAQKDVSFEYDTTLEVVTPGMQKLQLASSGAVRLSRPDRLSIERLGGFVDIQFLYDGQKLTIVGKNRNVYSELPVEARSVDELIDNARDEYNIEPPVADLLYSNVYDQLSGPINESRDLGAGVIDGIECEHLAFRTDVVDWEIWVRNEGPPIPCRYVITSKLQAQAPQYAVQITKWETGPKLAADDFVFHNATGASKVELVAMPDVDDLPPPEGAKQ